MRKGVVVFLILVLGGYGSLAQSKFVPNKKGSSYFFWGWNRAAYGKSNISFKGADYNFKLYNVRAQDRPSEISYENYLKLDRITIPQTNFRIGYFVKDGLAVSIGVDHMKYVMQQDQVVKMKGSITRPGQFLGNYNGDQTLTEDFLTFEHTDGLNYANIGIEKYYPLLVKRNFWVDANLGGGIGLLVPKTNAKLLDYNRNDRFHLSGFGLDARAGVRAVFFKMLEFRLESKVGYINMPNVILHEKGIDGKAKHAFLFSEAFVSLGGVIKF